MGWSDGRCKGEMGWPSLNGDLFVAWGLLLTGLWWRMSCLVCVCVREWECHGKGLWRRKWSRKSTCCRGILLEQNDGYQEMFLQEKESQRMKTSLFDQPVDPLFKTNVCVVARLSWDECLQSHTTYLPYLLAIAHLPYDLQEPQRVSVFFYSTRNV